MLRLRPSPNVRAAPLAAMPLPPTYHCDLYPQDVPSKRINSVIKQLYALNAEKSIMVESTKVIPALLPKIQKIRRNKRGRLLGFQILPKRKEYLLYERYHLGKR